VGLEGVWTQREFRANMPAVHAETGCIEYGPATDTPEIGKFQTPFGPDTFVDGRDVSAGPDGAEPRLADGDRRVDRYDPVAL
jgi:hypothetical protein